MISTQLEQKRRDVVESLSRLGGAVVAFSGGVDSTLLLRLAREALGDRCVALTAVSPSLPRREREEAKKLAREIGVRHLLLESKEVEREEFASNPTHRCYFCKDELFDLCFDAAEELGLPHVVYGATADDVGDFRPGMQSARERGARAPLLDAGLGKTEIRDLSRLFGLPTWDKPAMACLASRFPTGERITPERLGRIERAEEALRRRGFRDVRVRFHGQVVRIEIGESEWLRLADADLRRDLSREIREQGFRFVSLDLEPFRSGRLTPASAGDTEGHEPRSG